MADGHRARLVRQLQLAFSGERAAALAYQGHARSVSSADEAKRIREIEEDEWHHRRLVGGMLDSLGGAPDSARELRALVIGRVLAIGCHLAGWFLPMYGAGRLERRNIREYEDAADYARESGREDLVDCLLTMAEVEWEHERYFRERIEGHRLTAFFRVWSSPPPKESIRAAYAERALSAGRSRMPASESERAVSKSPEGSRTAHSRV